MQGRASLTEGIDGHYNLKFPLVFLLPSCLGFRQVFKVIGYEVDLAGSEVRGRLMSMEMSSIRIMLLKISTLVE